MDTGSIRLINETECLEIVKNSLKLNDNEVRPIASYEVSQGSNELVGFMGEYFFLDVYLKEGVEKGGDRHLRFFVKSVPISNEFHKNECERKGFFGKESRIYSEILCNLQKFAPSKLFPECYYTRKDLIVLEDLVSSKEALRQTKVDEEFTFENHKIVLQLLARLHAASLAWEHADNFNIGERFKDVLFELQTTMSNEWYVTGIKGIIYLANLHRNFQSPKMKEFINEKLYTILANACALTEPSKKLRNVVCHRDTWDRNIFFKYNNEGVPIDCRIVDFQLTRYNVPGTDVLYFLYVTTDIKRRQEIYTELLDYYYQSFEEALRWVKLPQDIISKEEFLEGCRWARFAVLIMWTICVPLMKMPEGLSNKMRAEEAEKFDFYMNTQRDELFTRIMDVDPNYENVLMNSVEELIEYLLENKDICEEFS